MFDTLEKAPTMVGPVTPEKQRLADQVSAVWANFAKTGRPSGPGIPSWPQYNSQTRPTMIFDTTSRVVNDPRSEQRKLMLSFGSQQMRTGGAGAS